MWWLPHHCIWFKITKRESLNEERNPHPTAVCLAFWTELSFELTRERRWCLKNLNLIENLTTSGKIKVFSIKMIRCHITLCSIATYESLWSSMLTPEVIALLKFMKECEILMKKKVSLNSSKGTLQQKNDELWKVRLTLENFLPACKWATVLTTAIWQIYPFIESTNIL